MTSLRSILNRFNEGEQRIANIASSAYGLERDTDGNLHITFHDGEVVKLPYIPFRPYQIELQVKLYVEGIKRIALERPRRSGKEIESWSLAVQGAVESPGLYMMVYPTNVRARAVLWDGSILDQNLNSIKFIDMVPKRLIDSTNNQEMKIKLINGSILWVVGSDIDPDKLRGTNPRGIVYSEFAFQDPRVFYVMLPALRQNGGWLICQSTFDGMNHFYQLIEHNKSDPLWYCRVDSIINLVDPDGNRYITDEMIEEDRRAGMPEYLIQQEYYGVVEINQETKYFAHALKNIYDTNRIIANLLVPSGNVYTSWDIGMNDCTGVVIFQVVRVQNYFKPIIIGYIESNNQALAYYVTEIRRFCARYNLILKDHFLPHDGAVKEFGTGKRRIEFLQEMGESGYVVPRTHKKGDAIEAIRQKLYLSEFNAENTQRLIDALANYSKEFDSKLNIYKDKPLHNWASTAVDAFQTMTLALDANMVSERVYDVIYMP